MKTVLNIGRDGSVSDIVIYDPTDVVSRSHATLRIDGRKYYITDHSTNGTYCNGVKLTPSVEYPVTKNDDISFGGVVSLDWNSIPVSDHKTLKIVLYTILVVLLLAILGTLIYFLVGQRSHESGKDATFVNEVVDTSKNKNPEDSLVTLPNIKEAATPKKKAVKKAAKKEPEEVKPAVSTSAQEEVSHDAL